MIMSFRSIMKIKINTIRFNSRIMWARDRFTWLYIQDPYGYKFASIHDSLKFKKPFLIL